jgi:RNA polymerase sigma-70 factor (ECF subfamily)
MVTEAAETYSLLERCQQHDRAAFAELFNRYHPQVFRSAYLIVRRQDAADDITQLVFVELFSAFRRFDLRRPFLPWLYRIVHNVSVDYLSRDRRGRALTPTTDAEFDLLLGPDPGPGPAEQVEQAELRRTIWAALEHLPVNQRAALVLSYSGGLNEHEVAEAMGVRPGTIKSRLHRARHTLRETLARDHGTASLEYLPSADGRNLANPAQEGGE